MKLHDLAFVNVDGTPILATLVGLEFADADGALWAKVTRQDGVLWQLGGDQPTEVRSKWVPADQLTPMGGM